MPVGLQQAQGHVRYRPFSVIKMGREWNVRFLKTIRTETSPMVQKVLARLIGHEAIDHKFGTGPITLRAPAEMIRKGQQGGQGELPTQAHCLGIGVLRPCAVSAAVPARQSPHEC
jgi:hypothetical protein